MDEINMSILNRLKSSKRLKTGLKIAGAVAGASAIGYGAYKLGKKFGGKRGVGKKSSVARLRNKVQKLKLKILEKQYKRKLFKEEMKI